LLSKRLFKKIILSRFFFKRKKIKKILYKKLMKKTFSTKRIHSIKKKSFSLKKHLLFNKKNSLNFNKKTRIIFFFFKNKTLFNFNKIKHNFNFFINTSNFILEKTLSFLPILKSKVRFQFIHILNGFLHLDSLNSLFFSRKSRV
jgi:hypothetical protein